MSPAARVDYGGRIQAPWTCQYTRRGCLDDAADNYLSDAEVNEMSMCSYGGCNDTAATTYLSWAT